MWIADLGNNHNGDLGRALALVEAAAQAGFHVAKVQLYKARELFAPGCREEHSLAFLERHETPVAWLKELRDACHGVGIKLGVTVCSAWACRAARQYADLIKIGSYELLRLDLIEEAAADGKVPLVLSTGGATMAEVAEAYRASRGQAALLHCVSLYPTPVGRATIGRMGELKLRFRGARVGYSDHTASPVVVTRAALKWDADPIELHLDLDDGKGGDFPVGHVWTKSRAADLISGLNEGMAADFCGAPSAAEGHERNWRADPSDGMRPLKEWRE